MDFFTSHCNNLPTVDIPGIDNVTAFKIGDFFDNIRQYVERKIIKQVEKKDYGEGMNNIIIIFYVGYEEGEESAQHFRHRGKGGEAGVDIDANKFIYGTFEERVDLFFNAIKIAINEFYKIMQSRKKKRKFDIEDFFRDLDIAKKEVMKIADK